MKKISLSYASLLIMIMLPALPMAAQAQTLEHIHSTGTLRLGYVPDQAPFSAAGADKEPSGYAIDLARLIADALKAKLGLSGLKVSFIPVSLESGLAMVSDGRIDMLCGAVSDTLERRKRVSFSIPIYSTGIGALLRRDAPHEMVRVLQGGPAFEGPLWRGTMHRALSRHTYAVHAGTDTEEWLRGRAKTLGVVATLVAVDDNTHGVKLVSDGNADAYFADRVILEHYASPDRAGADLMILDRYFTYEPLAFALPRADEDLRLLVDATLSGLYRSDRIVDIYRRYFGEPGDMTLKLFKIFARR